MNKKIDSKVKRYLYENYQSKTDAQMAKDLEVTRNTVIRWRNDLGLNKRGKKDENNTDVLDILNESTTIDIKTMTDEQKRKYFLEKLRKSPRYQMTKKILTSEELQFYEAKYIEYATSPEIETLTPYEEDDLHELTMTQISKMRIQQAEYDEIAGGGYPPEVSRSLRDKDETILKLKKSLDIERSQRLQRQEDSATNFINLVKEFNNVKIRNVVGREASAFNSYGDECLNKMIDDNNAYGIEKINTAKYYNGGEDGRRGEEIKEEDNKKEATTEDAEEIKKDFGEEEER